jgi:hypothetical protein
LQLTTLEIGLDKLLMGMTSLSSACQVINLPFLMMCSFYDSCLIFSIQEFCTRSVVINEHSKIANITLKQHPSLLELLELPQLIATCVKVNIIFILHTSLCCVELLYTIFSIDLLIYFVKSQHYEEAMELQQFAIRLYQNYPDIPVIANIVFTFSILSKILFFSNFSLF